MRKLLLYSAAPVLPQLLRQVAAQWAMLEPGLSVDLLLPQQNEKPVAYNRLEEATQRLPGQSVLTRFAPSRLPRLLEQQTTFSDLLVATRADVLTELLPLLLDRSSAIRAPLYIPSDDLPPAVAQRVVLLADAASLRALLRFRTVLIREAEVVVLGMGEHEGAAEKALMSYVKAYVPAPAYYSAPCSAHEIRRMLTSPGLLAGTLDPDLPAGESLLELLSSQPQPAGLSYLLLPKHARGV